MKKGKLIGKIFGIVLVLAVIGSIAGGLLNTASATSEKTVIFVTDPSPWFTKGSYSGHPEYWWWHTYNGFDYISTYVGGMSWLGGSPSEPDAWAQFKPYLSESGHYDVYAYFYACVDTSTRVPFTVCHSGGSTKVTVNQYSSSPTWKEEYLGRWYFAAVSGTSVMVTDATGEPFDNITGLTIAAVQFVKVNQPPDPPTLVSPVNGATDVSPRPMFKWNKVPGALYYGLYVSQPPYGESNLVIDKVVYGTYYALSESERLQPNVKYCWNMASYGTDGWSYERTDGGKKYSDVWYFDVTTDQVVTFPDPNLEAVIREAIGKPTGDIYQSDVDGLTGLTANERNIVNLTGLEHCSNLRTLTLWVNQISDISPLASLTDLCWLDLGANQISDISPLASLTNLSHLCIDNNQISDIYPLASLINLRWLALYFNHISDISPLASLTNLKDLQLQNNWITDISALASLTNLKSLWLNNVIMQCAPINQISDIKPLVDNSGLAAGDEVNLRGNPLSSTSLNTYIPILEARGATVYYDAAAPNQPPNTPFNPSPSNHATGVLINADLSWTGGDPDAGDTVTYNVYFGTSSTPPLVSDNQAGTSYNLGTLAYNTKYYWKVLATDNHGSPANGPLWDFTTQESDPTIPTVWIDSPINGDTFTTATITVSGGASDNVGVSKVEVKVGSGSWQLASGTTSWSKPVTLSPGSNTIYAKATDTSGNPSSQPSVTVTYNPPDTFAPTVSISYPSNGQTFTTATITVSGTASDNVGVSKVEVKVNSGSWMLASGTTSWSKSVTLSPGSNTIHAKATDTSGNPSSQPSVTVTYKASGQVPEVTGVEPAQPEVRDERQPFSILGGNFVSGLKVTLKAPNGREWVIPRSENPYINVTSTRIDIQAGFLISGTWTIWVTNPDEQRSNVFGLTVTPKVEGNLAAAARAALMFWEPDIAVTMVAIAGAESGWIPDAGGDSPSILRSLGYEESANKAKTYNCPLGTEHGYASWGLWQIFMPVHKSMLESLGAPKDDSCATADWLKDPANSARAAFTVWQIQGFGAWSVYNNGGYMSYLPDAQQAVDQAILEAYILSPGELRIYDSIGRVTGLVEGELRKEIPNSLWTGEGVAILNATDSYYYEVVGTDEGTYGLNIFMVRDGNVDTFSLRDAPITANQAHQYTINWKALAQGEEGVTIEIDSDGDGDCEELVVTSQPYAPSKPSPANDAAGIPINADLSWSSGDPDAGDTITYDVYFGTSGASSLKDTIGPYAATQSLITYNPGTLVDGAKYYWKVVARDNHGITREGPLWDFTVGQLGPTVTWNLPWGLDGDPAAVNIWTYPGDAVAVTLASVEGSMPAGLLIWHYGGPTEGWRFYKKGWGAVNTLETLMPGKGYIAIVATASVWEIPQG